MMGVTTTHRTSVVVIGKESSGKSRLIESLTGQRAYAANYRGITVTCEIFPADNVDFVDTPGILLKSDSMTTALALDKLHDSDRVLLVLKAPDLDEDLQELLPLLMGRPAVGVVTFWDKVSHCPENSVALEQISRQIGMRLIPVDARYLTEVQRRTIATAVDLDVRAATSIAPLRIPWSIRPRTTPLENRMFGSILALLLLLAPAVLAVWSANHFADWLDPSMEGAIKQAANWLAILPSPLKDVAIGKYGLITMGPLLFVWAVPTVLVYALVVGSYKASGLLDRITVALHPVVRRIGVTGRDLVRIVMGLGCNVPAVINSRCCSSATRDVTISAIAFGAACSYQFGATLSVFAAVSRPYLAVPFLAYLVLTTVIYMRSMMPRVSRTPFLILSMDKADVSGMATPIRNLD
jgi:Fe2+ transport system protein B